MTKWKPWKQLLAGLCLALPLLLITAAVGWAGPPLQEGAPPADHPVTEEGEACLDCHGEIHDEWTDSMHGQAASDIEFQQAWKKEGSPVECMACHTTGFDATTGTWEADGVACTVCHAPEAVNHPDEIMPTKGSSESCGACHEDTFAEWQESTHGEESLACVNCHNPHTTGLRANSSQELCQTCHNQESHFYDFTAHAAEGLLCTDCHLRVTDSAMGLGEGHSGRMHTFEVDLRSCTQCHGEEMHYPVQNAMLPAAEMVPASMDVSPAETTTEASAEAELATAPSEASSFTYLLAAAVGIGLGLIFSPVVEGVYRRAKGNE